jgi:hypothetical protein
MSSTFSAKDAKRMRESRLTFVADEDKSMSVSDLWHSCKKFKGYVHDWVQLNQRERKIEELERELRELEHLVRLYKLEQKANKLEEEIAEELKACETDLFCLQLELFKLEFAAFTDSLH